MQIAMTPGNDTKENSSVSRLFRLYSNIIKVEMLLLSGAKKVKRKQKNPIIWWIKDTVFDTIQS